MSWLDRIWPFPVKDKPQTLQGLDFRYSQWEPLLPPDVWTWPALTAANMTHEAALFQQTARLCDTLFRDDHLAGLIQTRLLAARGLPFFFLDPDGTVSEDEELYRDWQTMFPKSTQLEVIFWTLFMGFCIGQNVWDMDTLVPRLQVWHPGNCYYDKTWKIWRVYTREGFVELTGENAPGNGKWVLFQTWIDERPWMAGIIRAIGLLLLIRQVCLPDWLKYAKQFTGSRVLTIDAMVSEIEDVQKTLDACQKLTTGSTIHLLEGMKLELLQPKTNSWEVFANLLKYIDDAMTILILGATDIVSGGSGGSKARAVVQDRPRQDRLESDVDILATGSRLQILKPYYCWNRGIDELSDVPTPVWDPTPPEDAVREAKTRHERASAAKTASEAAEKLVEIYGDDFDIDEFARQYNIPLKSAGKASIHAELLKRQPESAIPGMGKLIAAVKKSSTPEELRANVIAAYKSMSPEALNRKLAKARVLAEEEARRAVKDKL